MLQSMPQDFLGVTLDIGRARDYIVKVDAKICMVKETYRKVKLGLPWKLPLVPGKDLVAYVVSQLNILRTNLH
jgi:hypothetical protein